MKWIFAALILMISGCGVLGAKRIPGGTMTSGALKRNIAEMIDAQQMDYLPGCDYEFVDSKVAGWNDSYILEEWVTIGCGQVTVYSVMMSSSARGGTDFKVRIKPHEDR